MANGSFVSYLRVSTQRQGQSGLGLEAQRELVARFLNGGQWTLQAEFVEVESGRKTSADRPKLKEALAYCKKTKSTLVLAKLDRLSRDVRYFLEVLDESKVDIRFADMPDLNMSTDEGRMMLISLANFAEFEGRRISSRTKAALAVAKARGVELGKAGPANLKQNIEARKAAADTFAANLRHTFKGMQAAGLSQRKMVDALNAAKTATPAGKGCWSLVQVQRVLQRLQA